MGYDNTIRVWDTSKMAVTSIIEDRAGKQVERDCQINSLSWKPAAYPPAKESLACVATVAGTVKVVDMKRGKVVS